VSITDKSIEATKNLETAKETFASEQAKLDRAQQTTLQTAQQSFAKAETALDRANQVSLTDKSIAATAALETARQTFASEQAKLDRAQQTTLQTADSAAKLAQLGYQYDLEKTKIPAAFAAQITNTTMLGVNTIMADSTLSATVDGKEPSGSSPKTRAVQNVINYANAQIGWANTFYGATIPPLAASTMGSQAVNQTTDTPVTQPNTPISRTRAIDRFGNETNDVLI
jgi:multidrug efflux pump subunit AcrA (membrane-fusion protein)